MSSFQNYTVTNNQTLVDIFYICYKQLKTLDYITDLFYKNNFYCNNTKNLSNKRKCYRKSYLWINKTLYLQIERQFLALIIVNIIVSIFYKTICNSGLIFYLAIANFVFLFCLEMLAFLFTIIYYKISEY